jgi:hypothetical protein
MLGPLSRKTPKKSYEKNPLSQGFRAQRQIPHHLVGFFFCHRFVLLYIGKGNNMEHEEKLDSVQLKYLYLLQSQLASQKIHFEGIIDRLEQQHRQEVNDFIFFYWFIFICFILFIFTIQREEIKEKVKSTVKENERLKVKEKKVKIFFKLSHLNLIPSTFL